MAGLTYKKAGVNIDEANDFVKKLKPLVRMTERAEVLGSIGGFGGLFAPRLKGMKKPVLVASTDGVGTKLMIADLLKKYDTIGLDLVAMNVDDVAVLGAEPLFFLDYIACGRLDKNQLLQVVKGVARGCRQANCALIGGETAELPGLYEPGKWDLAGFCVGLVEACKIIDGRRCRPGDKVIGLASSGLHSNGYSLARRVFTEKELKGDWGRQLLRPTKIYTPVILQTLKKIQIKAMAHITGGGFYDNIPRVIPAGLQVRIKRGSWPVPRLFKEIQRRGEIADKEMLRTLNMGIGLVAVV
ncbi:MAG: phosphoribosylformylglycinamidine cyclo-ligase, partial [Acidobacteria bacterium]|nr:phosphoribosylformylglycinamidine cyclo-ligase [Acidobacteriota bacterium]